MFRLAPDSPYPGLSPRPVRGLHFRAPHFPSPSKSQPPRRSGPTLLFSVLTPPLAISMRNHNPSGLAKTLQKQPNFEGFAPKKCGLLCDVFQRSGRHNFTCVMRPGGTVGNEAISAAACVMSSAQSGWNRRWDFSEGRWGGDATGLWIMCDPLLHRRTEGHAFSMRWDFR